MKSTLATCHLVFGELTANDLGALLGFANRHPQAEDEDVLNYRLSAPSAGAVEDCGEGSH